MEKLSGGMTEKDKQILKAVAPLFIVIILFFVVGKFGISQIKNTRQQINTIKKTESVLTGKLKILQSISEVSASGADISLVALPENNPALSVISQIKFLAFTNSIVIESIKSSTPGEVVDLSYVTTSFTAIGTKDSILSFIRAIDTIAPISVVEKMDISTNAGSSEASVSMRTYFASLPKTIPTITQAITDLNASEKELLSDISLLTAPVFGEPSFASASAINQNPFGQ